MWNFLIKLVKEFYNKCPFWHHETRWQKKKYNYSCDNFIGNNLRIHKHSIHPASFFQKWNQILQKDNIIVSKLKLPKFVLFIKIHTVEPRDNEWTSYWQNMFNPSNKVLLFQSSFWYILPLVGWGNLFRTVYTKDFIG